MCSWVKRSGGVAAPWPTGGQPHVLLCCWSYQEALPVIIRDIKVKVYLNSTQLFLWHNINTFFTSTIIYNHSLLSLIYLTLWLFCKIMRKQCDLPKMFIDSIETSFLCTQWSSLCCECQYFSCSCFQSESAANVLHVIQHPHVIVIFFFFFLQKKLCGAVCRISRSSFLLSQLFRLQFETFSPNLQSEDVITLNLSAIHCKCHFGEKQAEQSSCHVRWG